MANQVTEERLADDVRLYFTRYRDAAGELKINLTVHTATLDEDGNEVRTVSRTDVMDMLGANTVQAVTSQVGTVIGRLAHALGVDPS